MLVSNCILTTKGKTAEPHVMGNVVFGTHKLRKEYSFGGVVLGYELKILKLVIDMKKARR